jgi:hypothetical protein
MNVSNVGSSANPYQANSTGGFRQQMQDFKGLSNALQTGDLSSAQSAFTTLQNDLQSSQTNGKSSPLLDPNTQVGKDFKAVQDALKSGDVKGAQDAFATLKQDFRGTQKAGGHPHRHQVYNDGDADDGGSGSTGNANNASTPAPGSTLNVTA